MIYVFDTCSLSQLKHFYPGVFSSLWEGLDQLFQQEEMISTREVWNELQQGTRERHPYTWFKEHRKMFKTPGNDELSFVAEILQIKHFQALISIQSQLKGTPVADPFVIASARIYGGTVVTEEGWDHTTPSLTPKAHAPKIPQICEYYSIRCINLELFMNEQRWNF